MFSFLLCDKNFCFVVDNWKKELETVLKGLKNKKACRDGRLGNGCLQYGRWEARQKLLKIMYMVLEKRKF